MKTLLLLSSITFSLFAQDLTIIPNYGAVKYDNAASKSLKERAQILGFSGEIKNDNKEFEATYRHMLTTYKSSYSSVLQHDISMKYKIKNNSFKLKVGFHYVYSSEDAKYVDLGTGYVGIVGLEYFNEFNLNKFSYGLDSFYSAYLDAHDEKTLSYTKMVDIFQLTPFFTYSRVFNSSIRNDLKVKLNIIAATEYKDQGYYSYEVEDTFVYQGFYLTLRYLGGEMRSGVIDEGRTLFNTKDLINNYYDCKIGYYFTPSLAIDISAGGMNYREYDPYHLKLLPTGRNSIASISLSAIF